MPAYTYDKVIELEPNNHEARLLLAQALVNLSLTEESLEHIEWILEEQRDHVRQTVWWVILGAMMESLGGSCDAMRSNALRS
mgnify:CR=1 FL=1